MAKLRKIAITGGPCAGKSTGLSTVEQTLSDFGWSVAIAPEAATHVILSGLLSPANLTKSQFFSFQELIADTQDHFEEIALRSLAIKGGEKQVLICDRGKMDNRAYMSAEDFALLLEMKKETVVDWRDRYDGVFHLVTAANGKEEFYTTANNLARRESAEEARELDGHIKEAWLGHTHLRVIDNSTLFEAKIRRLLQEIQRLLGIPVVLEIERKFRVHIPVNFEGLPVPFNRVQIEQAYLLPDVHEPGSRIRKRGQDGGNTYYQTFKIASGNMSVREEREERITALKYRDLMEERDPSRGIIRKERNCFLWKNQYFELDVFLEPEHLSGFTLLELELTEENSSIELPGWLGKVTDVTEDPDYQNYNLAKIPGL